MRLIKISLLLLFNFTLFGQDINPTEIIVIEGFEPTIPDSEKIQETTDFVDTTKVDKTQEYNFIDKTINANYVSRPLVAAKVKGEKLVDLHRTSVMLGFGSHSSLLSNIAINSLRIDDYSYGLLLDYFNISPKLNDNKATSREQSLVAFGKKISQKHIFLGSLNYTSNTYFSYGHIHSNDVSYEANTFKNRFNYTRLSISAISREIKDNFLKHNTTLFISDLNGMSENRIHLSSEINKHISGFPVNILITIDNYINDGENISYLDDIDNQNVQLLSVTPSINLKKFNINFDLGFGIDYEPGGGMDIFPSIIVKKEIVKDILFLSLGIQDDQYRNTYKTLSDINPYIHSYGTNQDISEFRVIQDLRTTESKDLFLKVSNVLGKDEVFEGSIFFGHVENFPYFNDTSKSNRFLVNYVDVWQLHANINYDWQINDLIGLNAEADYYNWSDPTILHRANIEAKASISINLRDKIKVYPSISYLGSREALNEDISLSLKPQFHANLAIDYYYRKSISAFITINNLTNSKKDIWKGYPEIGINALFGFRYSF